jgi:putative alpha-1,2-mannosidase
VLLPILGNKELGATVNCPADKQSGEPGYYKAVVDEMGITAEMTCTKRAAIHRYTFPKSDSARVLVDTGTGILYTGKGEISGALVMAIAGGAIIPPIMGAVQSAVGENGLVYVLIVCIIYLLGLGVFASKNVVKIEES